MIGEGKIVASEHDHLNLRCPTCGYRVVRFEVVATRVALMDGCSVEGSPTWTAYEGAFAVCDSTSCEHVGTLVDFLIPDRPKP